jgi:hypothetical protein
MDGNCNLLNPKGGSLQQNIEFNPNAHTHTGTPIGSDNIKEVP